MTKQKKKSKGLSDKELAEKYEAGKFNLGKILKKIAKKPKPIKDA